MVIGHVVVFSAVVLLAHKLWSRGNGCLHLEGEEVGVTLCFRGGGVQVRECQEGTMLHVSPHWRSP